MLKCEIGVLEHVEMKNQQHCYIIQQMSYYDIMDGGLGFLTDLRVFQIKVKENQSD